MERLLANALRKIVRTGTLRVTYASGRSETYGDGSGSPVAIRFADQAAERLVALDPSLRFGEMFMEGRVVVEQGSVYELISLVKRNGIRRGSPHLTALMLARMATARLANRLKREDARRNVAHHYDLDAGLFDLFLDKDKQYSCAYFADPKDDLETAQLAKKRHIAAKLRLESGAHVLDIGCGWGGLALYLAEVADVKVTGITLSKEQLKIARQRASERGLSDRVSFHLQDYRSIQGTFDRIVSVGMFEHVGTRNYRRFFAKTAAILEPRNGVMLLHSIGQTKPTGMNQPWGEKYIFPGGYIPALSEVLPGVERAGFLVKDIEILSMHYAWTLRHWRERFLANRDKAAAIYDERFCRMWEYYLAMSESAFRHDLHFVFQMQLARHLEAVPYTRNYQRDAEADLAKREIARGIAAPS